jgi:hypothetical protein
MQSLRRDCILSARHIAALPRLAPAHHTTWWGRQRNLNLREAAHLFVRDPVYWSRRASGRQKVSP